MDENLIKVKSLRKEFRVRQGFFAGKKKIIKAVDGLNFSILKGETFGLVGESGCGKSTTGKLLMRLLDPTSGKIFFKGQDLTAMSGKELMEMRGNFQMVFQNPYGSLNPKMSLKEILEEPLKIHRVSNRGKRLYKLLDYVGLSTSFLDRYPHEFSGGQRQRISIARALALTPKFIVADEPVSALDVSIQAQILNLLVDLQKELKLTYLFISHDLGVVQYVSDRAGVMYMGKILEMANCDDLYETALHPYTKALLSAIPLADPHKKNLFTRTENPGLNFFAVKKGCPYSPRCKEKLDICQKESPLLKEHTSGHFVACHLYSILKRDAQK